MTSEKSTLMVGNGEEDIRLDLHFGFLPPLFMLNISHKDGQLILVVLAVFLSGDDPNTRKINS